MKKMRLFEALGKVDENLIAEASPENKPKKNSKYIRWAKRLAVAACIGLVIIGAVDTLGRLDYTFKASCGAGLGTIVDGTYYYSEPHKGIFKYTPEAGAELLLHTYWFGEDWAVNEYGIYYRDDMSVYVCDHETGTRTKLYTSDSAENTHMRFQLWQEKNILVTNYNKNTEIVYEVLVDGINGEVLETVMEKTSYDVAKYTYYSDLHYQVGDREITLEPVNENRDVFIVLENGENILPDDFYVTKYPDLLDGILIFTKYTSIDFGTSFVAYSDGTNQVLTFPTNARFSGNDKYLYYPDVFEETIGCVNARTGESWYLKIENNGKEYNEMHNVMTDGEYLYTCGPAGGETALWKLVFNENGTPIGMSLIDNDIKSEK
ncbi:MAG: hypothetical protein IJE49_09745 [Agathobacter sp.]|nr:hypothetical protein [Agathobacter sp.]